MVTVFIIDGDDFEQEEFVPFVNSLVGMAWAGYTVVLTYLFPVCSLKTTRICEVVI
jgi:hypothetical protein